jgi:hypothetical protein
MHRTYGNMRTDVAWQVALNADQYNLFSDQYKTERYDLGIVIVPKKIDYKRNVFGIIGHEIRPSVKVLAIMQEGPNWLWQDWPIRYQIEYFNMMGAVDRIYCHNESDVLYFQGMFNHDDVRVMPSLMIEDAIPKHRLCPPHERSGVMIGGNFVSWYGGFDSYRVAMEFEGPVFAPSMGRKSPEEDDVPGIEHLPYLAWSDWMVHLSRVKYGVHLMRTHAAGTFALNCAYLGIPCIGYKGLDTQQLCFPELSVNVGDVLSARKVAQHLANTPNFYEHCVAYAQKAYRTHFSEDVFLRSMLP